MNFEEYYKGKIILILGGAGFIGSNLASKFIDLGAKVKILDGFVEGTGANIDNIKGFAHYVDLYKCKIEEFGGLTEIIQESDFIIDSMAFTSHHLGVENPILDAQLNLMSHIYLINGLKNNQRKKVIYLGSRGQYGNIKDPVISEETQQTPIDPQGINKSSAEGYFKFYAAKYDFYVTSLRITNCFGENQKVFGDDIGLVGSFIKDILDGKTVEIYEDKQRQKNLIYVKDLVKIITKLGTYDFSNFEAYNAAGLEVTLAQLLDSIIGCMGKGKYIVKPFPENIKSINVGEARFSDNKLRHKLGDIGLTDLNNSLINTIKYFEERLNGKR